MKFLKSDKWIRLRGQLPIGSEIPCKIDTKVSDILRLFLIPETEAEKKFFTLDSDLHITGFAIGPVSHNAEDEWGWRLEDSIPQSDIDHFIEDIAVYMDELFKVVDEKPIKQVLQTKLYESKDMPLKIMTNFSQKKNDNLPN